MIQKLLVSPVCAPLLVMVIVALSFGSIGLYPAQNIFDIMDGWFNSVTYCCYAFALGVMISHFGAFETKREKTHLGLFMFLFFAALLREMGIQHWLTTTDTTAFKLRFFTNPNNPITEKIVAGILLIVVISVVLYLTCCYFVKIFKGFFKFNTLAWTCATLAGTGIICKIADRMPSHLAKNQFIISDLIKAYFELFEETTELCLPLICALWFYQYYKILQK